MATTAESTKREPRDVPEPRSRTSSAVHVQSLEESAQMMISEARMVLPGVQALFGFQLIAIFSDRFGSMSPWLQGLHLLATGLVALVVGLIMAPAAYHRIAERGFVSQRFTDLGSSLISAAMLPLAVAIASELYLLVRFVSGSDIIGVIVGAMVLAVLIVCWFVAPAVLRWRRKLPTGLRH